MRPQPPHRKQVKHYDDPGQLRELTFSCYQRMPLLVNDSWKAMLSASIDAAMIRHNYDLAAFVFMPEHVHLIAVPHANASPASKFLYAIKRPFSYRVKSDLQTQRDPILQILTIRERPGKGTFRFWQEVPGYDRNLIWGSTVLEKINYLHNNPVKARARDLASGNGRAGDSMKIPITSQIPICRP